MSGDDLHMNRSWFRLVAACLIAVAGIGAIWIWASRRFDGSVAVSSGYDPAEPDRSRRFSLIDSQGEPVTDETFRGAWLVVFFGFTNCPDACPTALFKLSQARKTLGAEGDRLRVAMVTVDPERDSPRALHAYLQPFGAEFIGLTGTAEQIEAAKQVFRAYAQIQAGTESNRYPVDHSTSFFVLDPRGEFRRQISSEITSTELAATLRRVVSDDKKRQSSEGTIEAVGLRRTELRRQVTNDET